MAPFMLQWQSWVAMTETTGHMNPNLFTILPFIEKFADPGLKKIRHQQSCPSSCPWCLWMTFLFLRVCCWAHLHYILFPPSQPKKLIPLFPGLFLHTKPELRPPLCEVSGIYPLQPWVCLLQPPRHSYRRSRPWDSASPVDLFHLYCRLL